MKKTIIVLTLMTSLCFAKAQSKVQFGLKAGANFSGWTGPLATGSNLRTGFYAGGFAAVTLNSTLTVKPELFFSSEGIKAPIGSYIVDFVRVPILLQYKHTSGFQMETGPQLGLLISGKLKSNDEETDIKNQLPPLDASWGIGFGYSLKSGTGFAVRYNFGLSEFGSKDDPFKTTVISAGLTHVFGER